MLVDKVEFGQLEIDRVPSPIGEVLIVVADGILLALDFDDCEARMTKLLSKRFKTIELHSVKNPAGVSDAIAQYFSGSLSALSDIPMATGGTPFQKRVWQELANIPPGSLLTYGELARMIGKPGGAQAVGMANSLNPISIALPCHRVIGANGSLTGYAGGIDRKQWLLNHEGICLSKPTDLATQLSVFS